MITRKIIFQGLEKGVLRHFATAFPFLTKRFQVQRKNISPSLSENFLCQKIEQKRSNSSSFRNSIMAQSSTAKTSHNATSAIEFLQIVTKLKEQKRTGWVIKNVKNPESIADHMYRMSIMALIAVDSAEINKDRCIKIALVHDIAEAIVGDIAPSQGISKEEKKRREEAAMDDMCSVLGGTIGKELKELWEEYEANETLEAKLVKDFDKVEMILQAYEYEKSQEKNLQEFFDSTEGKFQTELGKAWASQVVALRAKSCKTLK